MKRSTYVQLRQMKLDYPICENGVVSYIGIPTDYILKNRLHLCDNDVELIREAYARYQDTVRDVLLNSINRTRVIDKRRENNKL